MTTEPMICPQCVQTLTQVGEFWICPQHRQISLEKPFVPMRIFLSYGHDGNEELVKGTQVICGFTINAKMAKVEGKGVSP